MEKKKLTLEDLKLESFLTELNDARLVKVQGGNGAYGDSDDCTTDDPDNETTEITGPSGCTCPSDDGLGCDPDPDPTRDVTMDCDNGTRK